MATVLRHGVTMTRRYGIKSYIAIYDVTSYSVTNYTSCHSTMLRRLDVKVTKFRRMDTTLRGTTHEI